MTKVKPLTYKKYKEIYSVVPRATVEVIIQTPKGIVLTKRGIPPYKGQWHFPGGTIFYKELVSEAVARVAKEEVGVEVEIKRILGVVEYPGEEKNIEFGWPVGIAHLVKIKSGKIPKENKDGEEVGVFSSVPDNIVKIQEKFLKKFKLLN